MLHFKLHPPFILLPTTPSCPPSPQTVVLGMLMKAFGYKRTITIGLGFQFTQLLIYGLTRDKV